jgi:cell division protein FtsX
MVGLLLWQLDGPISRLALQYNSHFQLLSLTGFEAIQLLAISGLLGLVAAFAVVNHHLNRSLGHFQLGEQL